MGRLCRIGGIAALGFAFALTLGPATAEATFVAARATPSVAVVPGPVAVPGTPAPVFMVGSVGSSEAPIPVTAIQVGATASPFSMAPSPLLIPLGATPAPVTIIASPAAVAVAATTAPIPTLQSTESLATPFVTPAAPVTGVEAAGPTAVVEPPVPTAAPVSFEPGIGFSNTPEVIPTPALSPVNAASLALPEPAAVVPLPLPVAPVPSTVVAVPMTNSPTSLTVMFVPSAPAETEYYPPARPDRGNPIISSSFDVEDLIDRHPVP